MSKEETKTTQEIRALRIGVMQNDRLVEERLFRDPKPISIGQSAKNTLVVPASNAIARSFQLFELVNGRYHLCFTESMDGRFAVDDQVSTLASLRQSGKAQRKGSTWHLAIPSKARGKIVIGDVTVLFQFVNVPPRQPRPQLPPSVRSSFWQNLDWALVGVVAGSFLIHFGFVLYLRSIDWPRKPDIEELPDRFVKVIVPPKKTEEKKEVAKADAKAEQKKEKKKEGDGGDGKPPKGGPKSPRDAEAEARATAERRAKMAAQIQSMGVLKILGAKGDGGTVADLVRGGDVSGDADKVFASIGGVGVAGAGGAGLRNAKGIGGTGSLRGGGSLRASGPGEVGTGDRGGERAVKAVVKESAPMDVDGTLDPSVIAREIRGRLGAVKACYENALKRNPNISGKLVLRFEVSSVGKVTSADIENDTMHDDEVASCIKSKVLSWRFPAPQGGSVQFSYPFIFQASK